mmetsp:Transcript_69395/g.125135  ORF Transcript_69395/g.125135 Transcript_69395/m.125135 type:complete len:139 (+) Transcript_69395:72-488(+)
MTMSSRQMRIHRRALSSNDTAQIQGGPSLAFPKAPRVAPSDLATEVGSTPSVSARCRCAKAVGHSTLILLETSGFLCGAVVAAFLFTFANCPIRLSIAGHSTICGVSIFLPLVRPSLCDGRGDGDMLNRRSDLSYCWA